MAQHFNGLGTDYFAGELVRIEQQYFKVQEHVARTDPADSATLAALRQQADDCVSEVLAVRQRMQQEQSNFLQWGRAQTNGVFGLFKNTSADYMRQVQASAGLYDELTEAVDLTTDEWRTWIRASFPAAHRDGFLVCTRGHENHESRQFCSVCGEGLA